MNKTGFWCEHIHKITVDHSLVPQWHFEGIRANTLVYEGYNFCEVCGARRPESSDGLDEIFDKHRNQYKSGKEWQKEISKDLREWKEDLSYKHRAKWTWEKGMPEAGCQIQDDLVKPEELMKEKPKKLWLVFTEELHKKFKLDEPFWEPREHCESFRKEASRIAIDWFEGILPEEDDPKGDPYFHGWKACLREIKQRLVEEKEAF